MLLSSPLEKTVQSRRLTLTLVLLIAASGCRSVPAPAQSDEDWIQLFNGENLDGWRIKFTGYELGENVRNTFRVEDGLLSVSYEEWDELGGEFGHFFYERAFSHYRVRAEYRFFGEQVDGGADWAFMNNGIMLHAQAPETVPLDLDFPTSLEFQLLGSRGDIQRSTGNLCTPGTTVLLDGRRVMEHCVDSSSPSYPGDQWVTAEALVLGDSLIRHLIEGDVVLEYARPQLEAREGEDGEAVREGYIVLQAESHPTQFRRVELLNLKGCMDPDAANHRSYYLEPDNSQCRY